MPIREIHGVDQVVSPKVSGHQTVTVTDGRDDIKIFTGTPYHVNLSPAEARFIAKQLVASARRVERNISTNHA